MACAATRLVCREPDDGPWVRSRVFPDGVRQDNVDAFLDDAAAATAAGVLDGVPYTADPRG